MGQFPCTKCGACCRFTFGLKRFGLKVKEDGSCVHLGKDDLCEIYETRPAVCRVSLDWAKEAEMCNRMQMAEGLPKKFRVFLQKEN